MNKYEIKKQYEINAELIASELARECGFETAFYDVATYQGKTGIISPSFLKKGETLITGEEYLKEAKHRANEKNIDLNFTNNSIENIMNAVSLLDPNSNKNLILSQLLRMWCFDIVIMESDRNKTNWSIIKDDSGLVRLAPIYDCSTMARMNTNVDSLLGNLVGYSQLFNILDSINFELKLTNDSTDNYYVEFSNLCKMYPDEVVSIMQGIGAIDTDSAIEEIENRINKDMKDEKFEIPYNVKLWMKNSIMVRLEIIQKLYMNNSHKKH